MTKSRSAALGFLALFHLGLYPQVAQAGEISIVQAWIAPNSTIGTDIPLHMTVVNAGAEADALLRVRCPMANFSEKVTVDKGGEGAPSRRAVPTIAVRAGGDTRLTAEGHHVMLLQTRQVLAEGETFECATSFRRAGPVPMTVTVRTPPT
ncbi:copper chaperone PCu(A)C [uncultured Methylobacterium sp.]|jgi:copper(I)-binding protein|uniref:copper chaperone PCu(A)C n=1 Tax=uncultured Methylobacterium sp. TaxID=157278 RepID=UPI0026276420|nr:copper chaperone PCu(A)C [uncultured Methylobacterium sp.]